MKYLIDPRMFTTGAWKELAKRDVDYTAVDYQAFFRRVAVISILPAPIGSRLLLFDAAFKKTMFPVVTNKFSMMQRLKAAGREAYMPWDLPELSDPVVIAARRRDLANLLDHFQRSRRNYLIAQFLATVLFTILIVAGAEGFLDFLLTSVPKWITFILVPIVGLFFYWWRQNHSLSYGMLEFFGGAYAAIRVISGLNYDYTKMGLAELSVVGGGIYIIVRGLDNIGKGLEKNERPIFKYWKRLF